MNMENDYLWNKTGNDAEVERLEGLLSEFRFDERNMNELRTLALGFKKSAPRRKFVLSFAFAVLASLLIISFGFWALYSPDEQAIVSSVNNPEIAAEPIALTDSLNTDEVPNIVATKNIEKVLKRSLRKQAATKPLVSSEKIRHENLTPEATKKIILTDDERFAYNQLMLALSITSAKLNLVKSKVEGVDQEENTPRKLDSLRRN
jgi:hypothetical protein